MDEGDQVLTAVIQRELEDGRAFLAAKGFQAGPPAMYGPDDVGAWTLSLAIHDGQDPTVRGEVLVEIDPARVGWHVEATASVYPVDADRGSDVDVGRVRVRVPDDPDHWARVLVRRAYVALWQEMAERRGDIRGRCAKLRFLH